VRCERPDCRTVQAPWVHKDARTHTSVSSVTPLTQCVSNKHATIDMIKTSYG